MQTTEPRTSESGARLIQGLKPFDPSTWTLPAMFSADTHVKEPTDLFDELPEEMKNNIPGLDFGATAPPGAGVPELRVKDQDLDGVGAEIIFPNKAMILFGLDDIPTQVAAMRVYNDWMADFCKVSPKRLLGVPCLSVYDIEGAVKEMHRALDMGLTGAMIWQVPDPRLPFSSSHYDPLWAAAAEAKAPLHFHILTGHSYTKSPTWTKEPFLQKLKNSVNVKTADTIDTLHDIMFSGVFERYPDLRIVLAESEVGWLPYILQQWDYYYDRFMVNGGTPPISRKPSEIFEEHVYCTFLEDFAGTRHFNWWGQNNCMWSNDYPHFNMTFPHSRANVIRHIGELPRDVQIKLVRDNAVRLYGIDI